MSIAGGSEGPIGPVGCVLEVSCQVSSELSPEAVRRENAVLHERLSRLNEAGLRISEDFELDAVLREVLDAARSLTAATRGAMTTVDDRGAVREFITSGLSDVEHQALIDLPAGVEVLRVPQPARAAPTGG